MVYSPNSFLITTSIVEEVEMHDGEHETSTLQNMLASLKCAKKKHIIEAGYSRVVRPHHRSLKKYKGLGHIPLLLISDLELEMCYSVELLANPAQLARALSEQICGFSYIWGYEHKGQVDLHHGDMRTNGTTMPATREADVIYINNFKFELFYIVNQEIRQILAASNLCDGVKIFAFEPLATFTDMDLTT
ncbi:hypothetical protein EDD85DRAFT_789065 [Armillaria nabsnona]|nr:hypothetical protein EDD85DRAFT_789065 [Armillaria nabsnona]